MYKVSLMIPVNPKGMTIFFYKIRKELILTIIIKQVTFFLLHNSYYCVFCLLLDELSPT